MEYSSAINDETLEVTLRGKFTFSDNKLLSGFLDEIEQSTYKKIIIDLKGIEFIDSAALGILLLIRDKCDRTSTALTLRNPQGQVEQIFKISRFNDLFHIIHE